MPKNWMRRFHVFSAHCAQPLAANKTTASCPPLKTRQSSLSKTKREGGKGAGAGAGLELGLGLGLSLGWGWR